MVWHFWPCVLTVGRERVEHARVDAVVLRPLPLALRRRRLVDAARVQLIILQMEFEFPVTKLSFTSMGT